jgi:hypothetical protein
VRRLSGGGVSDRPAALGKGRPRSLANLLRGRVDDVVLRLATAARGDAHQRAGGQAAVNHFRVAESAWKSWMLLLFSWVFSLRYRMARAIPELIAFALNFSTGGVM